MHQRALTGYEKASLSHTITALNAVKNLGVLYRNQAKMEQARKMFQRAALGREKVLGPHHPHTLEVVNYLRQLDVEVTENEGQNGQDTQQKTMPPRQICLLFVLLTFAALMILVLVSPSSFEQNMVKLVHPDSRKMCVVGPECWKSRKVSATSIVVCKNPIPTTKIG